MSKTVQLLNVQKAVLSYFCQSCSEANLILLRDCLVRRAGGEGNGKISYEEFQNGLMEANMPILPREFEIICKELDQDNSNAISYKIFLDQVYVTKMYLKELQLYNTL